jgi:putative peptidoglycan lipid II flippase
MQVPETLIGTAIAIVLLPTLAGLVARGEKDAFRTTFNRTFRVMLALTIPAAVLLGVGVRPLVGVLGFDPAGSELVVWTTRFYLLGLTGHALLEITARSFYAQQDARTPLIAAIINAGAYTILATLLARLYGVNGIALANSLAFTSEALLLLYLLNRRFPGLLQARSTLLRVALAAGGSAFVVYVLLTVLPLATMSVLGSAVVGIVVLGLGGLLVLPFIWPEVKMLVQMG